MFSTLDSRLRCMGLGAGQVILMLGNLHVSIPFREE